MPSDSIQMTNISSGGTITSPFTLQIQYTLTSSQTGSLTISDTAGATILPTPQPAAASQSPTQTQATLTYTFPHSPLSLHSPHGPPPPPPPPITGESITVDLLDSSQTVVATQTVDNITVNPAS
jgi:hypothetical protein